ncbi:pentatricopeptide repeat-containing protein At3g29230-like [Zingiber officinale]|uniref:Chlororespiratory reduction 4 n=1 Tax=Zingiber officinale TaxID=94328 RepID=A0A8J5LEW7_ZINOF|nr:pentatricopeptide repeat-containing protein At3g29230-like [Zingiber officinale]KAG6515404.1 hypothetical protein ZIOFF_025816 [Zingiber officinale]
MSVLSLRPPQWTSHRRLLEQKLVDLHRCSDYDHLRQIQAQILKADLHRDLFVAPKLISAYSLCRQVLPAVAVFRQVPFPNAHLYNVLIRAFADNSQPSLAFSTFCQMQKDGIFPDKFTYSCLLRGCSGTSSFSRVLMIHAHVLKFGFLSDIFVPNALIDSYSKTSAAGFAEAKKVFDGMPEKDVVSWNSILAGAVRAGEVAEARQLFDEMPERDIISWNTLLDGLAKAGEMESVFDLFGRMPERNVVSWSTILSGYCKSGDLEMARDLFDKMPVKNLVTWTIIITGYAEKGQAKEASRLLDQMEEASLEFDVAATVSILAACAESGLLSLGKRIHSYVKRSKLRLSTHVSNALIDMYSKCGCIDKAWSVFKELVDRDLVSWNCVIQGLAVHGHGKRALSLFARMKMEGIRPNAVTFIGVLCACTHMGLVEDARSFFYSMETDYGIVPQIEHYGCMIDVLGRVGFLHEAFHLAKTMPSEPNAIIWCSLLNACRLHNNVGLAEEAVNQLVKFEPSDAGNYAILSNIYAAAKQWEGVAKARTKMKGIGRPKPAGSSWIELGDTVHEFTAGDRKHPQTTRIFKMLDKLSHHIVQVGHAPKEMAMLPQ